MIHLAKTSRELAYLYDIYIAPIWRGCFDQLFAEKLKMPEEGRVLEVNCGTAGQAIHLANALAHKGEVIAVDKNIYMLKLAQAKSSLSQLSNLSFVAGDSLHLNFPNNKFDLVIGDYTFSTYATLEGQIKELMRVAKPGGQVVANLTTRGSFDEFFSIFWEALYECELSEEALPALENLINNRPTLSEAETLLSTAGLTAMHSFQKKEEFLYETATSFFTAPLIEDYLLPHWFSILPPQTNERVQTALTRIIERERGGYNFDISIKATVIVGEKRTV